MKNLLLILLLIPFLGISQVQIGQSIEGFDYYDLAGGAISISNNGEIVAVNYRGYDGFRGKVNMFELIDNEWTQIGQSLIGENQQDDFGRSVSLSNDGLRVAIGVFGYNSYQGLVRIYDLIGNSWVQVANDILGEAVGDRSGASISLSNDGNSVAIGAYTNDGGGESSGHARIYEFKDGLWLQKGQDLDGEAASDLLSNNQGISLSSNGNIVALGSSGSDVNGNGSGRVRIFEFQDGTWVQLGQSIDGEGPSYGTGDTLSLTDDGSKVAIGSYAYNSTRGQVQIFEFNDDVWQQIGQNIIGEYPNGQFGRGISLSNDATIVVIGAEHANTTNGVDSGLASIFEYSGGIWNQLGENLLGEHANASFGQKISLTGDGTRVAISAPSYNGNSYGNGHVKVYDLSTLLSVNEYNQFSFELFPNPAKNQFTIQLQNNKELKQVNIYNNLVQLVKTVDSKVIKTTNLATGLYYVEVITNTGKATKKLVIE